MPTTETSIFFQHPELATPEEDVRIEVIKALLNKSNLDPELITELAVQLDTVPDGALDEFFHMNNEAFRNYFNISEPPR